MSNLAYLVQVILPSLPLASFQRLFDLCESFKIRYICIHVMNYYVCANIAAYENSLLCIFFGFLLLSVLFCSDSHHGVLSKHLIYNCLVRNRELITSFHGRFVFHPGPLVIWCFANGTTLANPLLLTETFSSPVPFARNFLP